MSKCGPRGATPQLPLGAFRQSSGRLGPGGMLGHVALTHWVPWRIIVGSDGDAGGADQTWRPCSLVVSEMGCDPI